MTSHFKMALLVFFIAVVLLCGLVSFILSPGHPIPLKATESIPKLLVSKDDRMIIRGLYWLLKSNDNNKENYTPLLAQCLVNKNSGVRLNAIQVTIQLGSHAKPLHHLLLPILKDEKEDVGIRAAAGAALVSIKSEMETVVPILIKLGDTDKELRASMIRELGDVGKDMCGSSAFLIKYINDKDLYIRGDARRALNNITQDNYWLSIPTENYLNPDHAVQKLDSGK